MQVFSRQTVAAAAAAISLGSLTASAQVSVGAGSVWSLGDSTIDWGCSDVTVNGTLSVQSATTGNADSVLINAGGTVSGGTGTLGLTGDFTNSGAFSKDTGTVAIRDGCSNTSSAISGGQAFHSLSVITSTGKTLLLAAGATTTIGPGTLTLQGSAGNLLKVRSTAPGTQALTALIGGQSISYVDVADNRGTMLTLAPGVPSATNSVNSGNVFNWFDVLPVIPTLSTLALLLLAFAIVLLTRRHGRSPAI